MKTLGVVNVKGGVGRTTLVYHLAHMLPRLGYPTLAADLDPQATLTTLFFDEHRLQALWERSERTVLASVAPVLNGARETCDPVPLDIDANLWTLAGDLGLARFERYLSTVWPRARRGDSTAVCATAALHRILLAAGSKTCATVALIDLAPTLSALNRAALLACDHLVVPLVPDVFALRSLSVLGATVRDWRDEWQRIRTQVAEPVETPPGRMLPAGYVLLPPPFRLDRLVRGGPRLLEEIPATYRQAVLGESKPTPGDLTTLNDPECLARLRGYPSLLPMSQEARRPMFDLTPADGALGSHVQLVQTCRQDFQRLAERIAERCELSAVRT